MATLKRRVSGLAGVLAPLGASGNVEADQVVSGRISGGTTTRRRTPAENAAIADFDKTAQRMGISDRGFGPSQIQQELASSAADHAARIKKDPYDIGPYSEDTSGTFGSQQVAGGGLRTAPTPVSPAERRGGLAVGATGNAAPLEMAGASVVGAKAGPLAGLPTGPYPRVAQFAPAPGSQLKNASVDAPVPTAAPAPTPTATPSGTPAATATDLPSPPVTPGNIALTPNPPVAPTPGVGRTTEAGVSNSQAAGFEQPTAANPIPKTPTSPEMNIDDYDKRNKKAFAGF